MSRVLMVLVLLLLPGFCVTFTTKKKKKGSELAKQSYKDLTKKQTFATNLRSESLWKTSYTTIGKQTTLLNSTARLLRLPQLRNRLGNGRRNPKPIPKFKTLNVECNSFFWYLWQVFWDLGQTKAPVGNSTVEIVESLIFTIGKKKIMHQPAISNYLAKNHIAWGTLLGPKNARKIYV